MKVAYMSMKNVSFIVTTLKLQWLTFFLLVLTGCTEIKATKNVRTGMCPNRKTISSYFYLNLFARTENHLAILFKSLNFKSSQKLLLRPP